MTAIRIGSHYWKPVSKTVTHGWISENFRFTLQHFSVRREDSQLPFPILKSIIKRQTDEILPLVAVQNEGSAGKWLATSYFINLIFSQFHIFISYSLCFNACDLALQDSNFPKCFERHSLSSVAGMSLF